MKPISLKLHNVGPHKSYTLKYNPGLTGIVGPNGSGKSTLIDYAQFFAITGNTPARYTKQSLVSWKHSDAYTLFTFESHKIRYELKRNLHNTQSYLKWREKGVIKELTKNSEVNSKMEDLLGISFDIFRETCFVSQGTFMEVVNMQHSARLAYFQRITGLKKAEDLRMLLQKKINEIPPFLYLEEEIITLKEQIGKLEDRINSSSTSLRLIKIEVDKTEEDLNAIKHISYLPLTKDIQEKIEDKLNRIKSIDLLLNSINTQESIEKPEYEITAEDRKILPVYKSYLGDKANLEECLKKLKETGVGYYEIEKKLSEMTEESSELFSKISMYKGRLSLGDKAKCPICSREFEDIKTTQELKSIVSETASKYASLQNNIKLMEKCIIMHSKYKDVEELLNSFDKDIEYLKSLESRINEWDSYLENVEKNKDKVKAVSINEAEKKQLLEQIEELKSVKAVNEEDKREVEKLEKDLKDLRDTKHQIELALSSHKAILNEKRVQLNKLENDQKKEARFTELKNLMSSARDYLHKDEIPKMIMQRILYCLNDKIGFYLDRFDTDFTATLTEDFDFVCDFCDSGIANKPAFTALSGGQKVALSLAFRFALSDVLGSNVPILVLDEPTVHLDEKSVDAMCEVFKEIKTFAEKGVYVFILTHNKTIHSAFTNCLSL